MSPLLRLLGLTRGRMPVILGAEACRIAETAADLALIGLLKRFVDEAAADALASWRVAAWAVGVAILRASVAYAGARLAGAGSSALVGDLQDRLFAGIHGLSLEFFHRTRPGDLVARLFHDADAAARLVTHGAVAALDSLVRLGALFAGLWLLHRPLALALALVVLPAAVLARVFGRRVRSRFDRLYADLGWLYDRALESLQAAELVKGLGRERQEVAEFQARNRELVRRETALHALQAVEAPVTQTLRLLAFIGAAAYGAREVAQGTLAPGTFAAALAAAYAFLGAVQGLLEAASAAQGGRAAAARVFELLDERTVVAPPAPGRPGSFRQALRFEGVGFAYAGRGPALEDVSFTLRPGERLAVVGPSGSGKTTLLRLALRLHDPTVGRITLDGVDLREIEPAALRSLFAVVPQETVVLDRSVRENVSLARPEASPREVERAARLVGLDEVAGRLPEGLDTVVGPRGVTLSAGERQRVALARATLRAAPVLLLDEATAGLDARSERDVEQALAAVSTGRTLVTVTHRLSSARGADRILVLDAGRLVELGSHEELWRREGLYRRLCEAGESRGASQPQAKSGP